MPMPRVAPSFDVPEDGMSGLHMGAEWPVPEQLAFKGGEEALGQGIVKAIPDRVDVRVLLLEHLVACGSG